MQEEFELLLGADRADGKYPPFEKGSWPEMLTW